MHFIDFKYNDQAYRINLSKQILEDKSTGEVCAINQIRDYGLITAVGKCIDNADRDRYYQLIADRMILGIEQEFCKRSSVCKKNIYFLHIDSYQKDDKL